MFYLNLTEETCHQPGILRVRITFGEFQHSSKKAFSNQYFNSNRNHQNHHLSQDSPPQIKPLAASTETAGRINIQVCLDLSTVRALYEGLLVTLWTTAQKRLQQRWSCLAQLALILVFFTALTIVGRCCASTENAAAPLDKFHLPRLQNNSINPFSKLVLDRLFIPKRLLNSDIRIIPDWHTKYVLNRNFRIKRQFENTVRSNNDIKVLKRISGKLLLLLPSGAAKNYSNDGHVKQQLSVIANSSEGIIGAGDSSISRYKVTVNETFDKDVHQNDGHFQDTPHIKEEFLDATQRSMPPVHAHDHESGNKIQRS